MQSVRAAALALLTVLVFAGCSTGPSPTGVSAVKTRQPTATQFVFPPTYTATVPGAATATPTARATRTPFPTDTPAPTLEATATPAFEILQASDDQLPFIGSSLLHLKDGELLVWDFLTLEKRALNADAIPTGIIDVSYSAGAFVLATARGSAPGVIEVNVYNRFSESISHAFTIDAAGLEDLALSPDAAFLALVVRESVAADSGRIPTVVPRPTATPGEGEPTPEPAPPSTAVPTPPSEEKQVLYLVDLLAEGAPVEVAACADICTEIRWNPSSSGIAWGDSAGLWFSESDDVPVRLLEPFLTGVSGAKEELDAYWPLAFSPSGRYLVVRKGLEAGNVLAMYDLVDGLLENLPGTGEYTGSRTGFTWMFGDLLAIARSGVTRLELPPAIEIWQVSAGQDAGLFSLFGRYIISEDTGVVLDSPVQLADGRLAFTVNHFRQPENTVLNGLYLLDAASGAVAQVNYLPIVRVDSMQWLPDGSAALIQTSGRLLFVPPGFGQIFSLGAFLGSQSCCYVWLP